MVATEENAVETGSWMVAPNGHVYAKDFYRNAPFTDGDGIEHPDYHEGLVALVYGHKTGRKMEANRSLIAAAPELLELLEEWVKRTAACGHSRRADCDCFLRDDFYVNIQDAIAKAKGST